MKRFPLSLALCGALALSVAAAQSAPSSPASPTAPASPSGPAAAPATSTPASPKPAVPDRPNTEQALPTPASPSTPEPTPPASTPPVPAPTVPAKGLPAPSPTAPAVRAPRPTQDFSLSFRGELQKIQGGKLVRSSVQRSWKLPVRWVARSLEYGKVTSYLDPLLDQVEKGVNVRGRPVKFSQVGQDWVATDQPEWTFDREATKAALLAAFQAGETSGNVVFKEKKPQRSVALLAERGVFNHLAMARSSFAGSPSFRVKNILVGSEKLDYLFVAPGEDFDFNKTIGEISAKTGFVPGYIISGGSLALEDGGGICQVSTTVFRALYEAGLPVTERHQHSHRVKYYDPIGYEATVYAPSKNLRMKNDTGKYLFLQATWNTATGRLRFDVFGTDDGRRAVVGQPTVTDVKPPATPSYMPDDRVALGQQRLLDEPMEGMTSVITRRVTLRSGKVLEDTLKSNYRPWGAVYGVHPQDPRLKPEQAKR